MSTLALVDSRTKHHQLIPLTLQEENRYFAGGSSDYCSQQFLKCNILTSSLMPIRTNNLESFLTDLIAPTLIHRALKVEGTVPRFFACLAAIVWDGATFLIRCVTVVPQWASNWTSKEHSLWELFEAKGIVKNNFKSDVLVAFMAPGNHASLSELNRQDRARKYTIDLLMRDVPYIPKIEYNELGIVN